MFKKLLQAPIYLVCSLVIGISVAYAVAYSLNPNAADTYDVGTATLYWNDVYAHKHHVLAGTNKKGGTFTCTSDTPVTVSNTAITANSIVIPTLKTVGGTVGAIPRAVTITPTTGFNVNCTSGDTSVYNYAVIEIFTVS